MIVFIAPMLIIPGLMMGVPIGLVMGFLVHKMRGRSLGLGRTVLYALLAWLVSAFFDCCYVGSLTSAEAGSISDSTFIQIGVTLSAVLVTLFLSLGGGSAE